MQLALIEEASVLFTVVPDFNALPLEISASEITHPDLGVVEEQATEAPVLLVKYALSNRTVLPNFALYVEGFLLIGRAVFEGEVDSVLGVGAVLNVLLDVELLGA